MTRRCLVALMAILLAAATPPFYTLLPFDYPVPLIRVCRTDYGICLIPFTIAPGAPCQCVTAGGVWVPGVSLH